MPAVPSVAVGEAGAALRSSGDCDFDLSGAKAESVFYVLGMLNEYNGRQVAARVNSCYRYEFTNYQWVGPPDGSARRRFTSGAFNFGLLYTNGGVDRVRARAYLAGAWRRWGSDGKFQFANASEKAEGIAMLLSELRCANVSVEHTMGTIPRGWTVGFTPTAEVAGWLEQR